MNIDQYIKDSQLPLLNSLQGSEFFTVIINGKNYRVQVDTLVQLALASQPAPADTRRYWQTVPGYTVDDTLRDVTVDATGVAFYNSTTNSIATATLTYAPIAVNGNARFDGLMLDTDTGTYTLIQGVEGQDPSTPGYNTQRYMLLAWLLIDENGSTVDEAPQTHPRNQDQFLDQGGANEISAAHARAAYLKSLHFVGVFDTDSSLPTAGSAPTIRSWALVGTTSLSIWLYSVDSAAWEEVQGAGGGPAVDRNVAIYADLATLPDKVDQENVYVADASGDATVDSGWAIYKYVQATTSFVKIAEQESLDQAPGGGPVGKELNVVFDSDLDTVSAHKLFQGAINNLAVVLPDELTGVTYEVRLDTTSTWTAQADLTALQSWIDSNVSSGTTKWQLRFIATYAASATGEAAALFTYQTA